MAVASVRHGPFDGSLDRDRIAAYAHATGDQTPSVRSGLAVPAVFPVILVFTPNEAARADLPDAAYQGARGGVHGEHDIVLHRPLIPGERLQTWSRISAVRTSRAGTQVVMAFEQIDRHGDVVVEQSWTMMLLGLRGHGGSRQDTGRAQVSRRSAGPPTRHRAPAHRWGHHTSATPSCPEIGRPTISTSRSPALRVSISCSPTGCARWRSARTACSAWWASTILAGFGASPYGSPRPRHWTAI